MCGVDGVHVVCSVGCVASYGWVVCSVVCVYCVYYGRSIWCVCRMMGVLYDVYVCMCVV